MQNETFMLFFMRESLLISCFKRSKKVYKIGHIIKTGYDENKYFIKMFKSIYLFVMSSESPYLLYYKSDIIAGKQYLGCFMSKKTCMSIDTIFLKRKEIVQDVFGIPDCYMLWKRIYCRIDRF